MRTATLYHGHVLDVLAGLPERSFQCCVTSPPYWGLRDYKLPPQIWDAAPGCPHDWADEAIATEVGRGNWAQGTNGRGEAQEGGAKGKREPVRAVATRGFCRLCGAWRGSLGLEPTVQLYVHHVVQVFAAVWRVLRDDGVVFLNLGDSYASGGAREATAYPKTKDLIGVPWRVALALQDAGWYLRSEIIWSKPAPMPESVRDRPTRAHEHIFLLSKAPTYFYDADAVAERSATPGDNRAARYDARKILEPLCADKGSRAATGNPTGYSRNMRTVWEIGPEPCPDAHFATFPSEIPRRAILAGTSAAGCCAACGAPWARVTSRRFELTQKQRRGDNGAKPMDESNGWQGFPRGRTLSTTKGWRPTCDCLGGERLAARVEAEKPLVVPCAVLDPFLGSGRTGITALELGRSFSGIDLSETYLETIARPAIEAALQAHVGEDEPPVLSVVEQGSLW